MDSPFLNTPPATRRLHSDRRSASDPGQQHRYGSVERLVSIADSTKAYKGARHRDVSNIFGRLPDNDSRCTSSSESRSTSLTSHSSHKLLQTPVSAVTQNDEYVRCSSVSSPSLVEPDCCISELDSPSLAGNANDYRYKKFRHNPHGHDLHFSLAQAVASDMHVGNSHINQNFHITKNSTSPYELPGSLLLPGQGYLHSDYTTPPPLPLKARSRRSASIQSPSISPSITPYNMVLFSPKAPTPQFQSPRESSLPTSKSLTAARSSSPKPLSRMSLEELLDILPMLDAAIIANDWLPNMVKRHKELKQWLQSINCKLTANEIGRMRKDEKDIQQILLEAGEVGKAYRSVLEIARTLKDDQLEAKQAELIEALANELEAVSALARATTKHEEDIAMLRLSLEEEEARSGQRIDVLARFIHNNLTSAFEVQNEEAGLVKAIMHDRAGEVDLFWEQVPGHLYRDLKRSFIEMTRARDDLRDLVNEQQATIRNQSNEMDEYVNKLVKFAEELHEQEQQNRTLRQQVCECRPCNTGSHGSRAPATRESEHKKMSQVEALSERVHDRDAEILNLRRKLDLSQQHEKQLQAQLRRMIESNQNSVAPSDAQDTKPAGRLKRFLQISSHNNGIGSFERTNSTYDSLNDYSEHRSVHSSAFNLDTPSRKTTRPGSPSGSSSTARGSIPSTFNECLDLPSVFKSSSQRNCWDSGPPPQVRGSVAFDSNHSGSIQIDEAIASRFAFAPLSPSVNTHRRSKSQSSATKRTHGHNWSKGSGDSISYPTDAFERTLGNSPNEPQMQSPRATSVFHDRPVDAESGIYTSRNSMSAADIGKVATSISRPPEKGGILDHSDGGSPGHYGLMGNRVLSGITEVSEISASPRTSEVKVYEDDREALTRLEH